MTKGYSLADIIPHIEEEIAKGKEVGLRARGSSMQPLINADEDLIVLSALPEMVKKGEIILYRRDDGSYVVHRVMKVKNDTYSMCGDHQVLYEHGISRNMMIARVCKIKKPTEIIETDKNAAYKLYVRFNAADKIFKNAVYAIKKTIKNRLYQKQ